SWAKLVKRLLNREQLAALIPFFAAFAVGRRERLPARLALAATVVASVYAITLGRCFFPHYFTLGMAGFALWAALGARALSELLAGAAPAARRWATVTVLALVVAQIGPRYQAESRAVYRGNDYVGANSGVPREIVEAVVANSAPTDRIATDGSPG